ncbi:MAG: ATP-binding protein [Gammaproteobacteria bacterium]|nr:ATP-binding protein [Gammaproteobacteria bacterium]
MEDAIAKANAASKAKSQFVANMSHEIRTPLTAILGFSESLLENDVPKDEYHNAAETIVRSGKHLQQIINDILDLSKIEAGQLVIETIKTDVRDVLDDVGSLMSKRAQSKNISFRIIKHYPLPGIITTDPTRLKQILLNIAGNAIKFTRHGQVTIELTFLFEQKQLRFEVKDTGIGMTPYELSKLFKPFTQADSTITRRFGGTGLGLVIAKQLVEKLGGEISVTSKKEVGTNFVFTIATGEFNEEGLISEDWSEPTNVIEIQKVPERLYGHVLFAEDGIENQQLIAMYVRKKGVTISIVDNGKAAVEAALKKEYDLILMDIQMPIMGGLEATEMLRTTGYDKPIVALTANAMKEDRDRCLAAGMDDYLSKPVELERFYRVLAKFLPKEKHKQEEAAMTNGMEQDPEFLALVQGFLKRLPEIVAEIRGGTDEQNWSQVQTASHKLKGMGGGFGFPELTSAARKINDDVRENRFADIEVAVGELELLVRSIMQSRAS